MVHTPAQCLWGAEGKESPSMPQAGSLDAGELPCIVHPLLPCTTRCRAPLAAVHPSLPCTPCCPLCRLLSPPQQESSPPGEEPGITAGSSHLPRTVCEKLDAS